MSPAAAFRGFQSAAVAMTLGGAGAFALLFLLNANSQKVLYSVLAGVLLIACAFLSGNVRLFNLWCFAITLTLDLSKHFGRLFEKMGGEAAFKIEVSDVFLLIMAGFQACDIAQRRRYGIHIPKLIYLWIAIFCMGFIPTVFGPYRLTAVHEMFRMLKVGLLFVIVTNELERPKRIVQCATGLCLAMIGQSTIGMVQYVTKKHLGLTILGEANPGTLDQLAEQTLSGVRAFRVSALMSHPNIFSIFLAVAILIAIACFLLRGRTAAKLVFVISALLGMAALIATLSRSGWLSFAAAFAVFMALMALHPGLQGRALLLGGCAGAGLFLVCLMFAGPLMTRLYESKDSAMLSRAEYNRTARAMIAVHPVLGWGLNSYVWVAPPFTKWGAKGARERFKGWLPPVHNIYLLWMAETGYVGFALHLALWIWIAATAVRNLDVANETLFAINVACLSGLVIFAFDGFFSFTWRINSIMRLYWLIAAIIIAIRHQKESKRPA